MATTGPRWAGLRGNPHSWCVVCTTQAWECSSWSKIEPWACFIYPDHLNHYLFLSVAVFYRLRRSLFAQLTALPFVLSCFSYIHMKCFGSSRVHRVQRLVLQKNICISLVFKRKVNKIKQDEKSWGEMLAPPWPMGVLPSPSVVARISPVLPQTWWMTPFCPHFSSLRRQMEQK